jgi:succinyl-CoA synthetase beta subunit
LYFAIFLDRSSNGPVMVASPKGGVDIEAVAQENPDLIFKEPVDINKGPSPAQIKNLVEKLHLKGSLAEQASMQINKLYQLFKDKEATLIEVNPLCETSYGTILCLDSKLNFDDSSLFRHPEIEKLDDPTQYDVRDLEARKADLNFIALDGDIGCLVNGAGLAMATMDMIKMCGGSPANFLDVGGGATDGQVSTALHVIASDVNVKAILVNIFGGIMKCDVIALGILNAVKILNLKIPIVLRLQGTNVKEAKALIEGSGLRVIAADDLEVAANKAVQVAKIVAMAKHAQLAVSFELPI